MSSHREAPEISKDPVADSTDLYAFVSPDEPDTVTIIANYVPLEGPDGGPNFYEFGNDVLYAINIDNDNDGQRRHRLRVPASRRRSPTPAPSSTTPAPSVAHRPRTGTAARPTRSPASTTAAGTPGAPVLGTGLAVPAVQHRAAVDPGLRGAGQRPRSTACPTTSAVFAGQRAEGFYVDLGAIFDLGILRPFEQDHATFGLQNTGLGQMAAGRQLHQGRQRPQHRHPDAHDELGPQPSGGRARRVVDQLGHRCVDLRLPPEGAGRASDFGDALLHRPLRPGVAPRQPARATRCSSPWARRTTGTPRPRRATASSRRSTRTRSWPSSCPCSTPACSPTWPPTTPVRRPATGPTSWPSSSPGIPPGLIPGFQNFTGTIQADMLRLNTAIAPATSPVNTGLLGGDVAGFPNGRRVFDDVVTIELRCLAGAVLEARGPVVHRPTARPAPSARAHGRRPATWPPWAPRTTCPRSRTSACPTAASWSRRVDGGTGPHPPARPRAPARP